MFSCLKWPKPQGNLLENTKMLRVSSSLNDCTRTVQNSVKCTYDPNCKDQIVIVGGGVCALWFAMHFHQFSPKTSIIILERCVEVREAHYVSIDPSVLKSYIGFKSMLGTSFVLGELYEELLDYIECRCEGIRVLNGVDQRMIGEIAHKAIFIMDGAARSYSNIIFTENVVEGVEYFIELQYVVKHETIPLDDSIQGEICARFRGVCFQEIVCGIHVVLRVGVTYAEYAKFSECKIKAFGSLPETQRRIFSYWLNARQTMARESVLGKVNITQFAFPIFVRTRFAIQRTVPYFVLGAAAFQLSLTDGLSRCMDMAATVAPLFTRDVTTLVSEYSYACESFLCKSVERRLLKKTDDLSYLLDHSGKWEEDFFN